MPVHGDRGEADRARAVLLTLAGWTSPKIAEAFGVREDTVPPVAQRLRRRRHRSAEGQHRASLTDPDSRAMAAHTKVGVGYNIQVVVDAKNKLIAEQAVTNQVVDVGLLAQTAEPAREILGGRDNRRRRGPRLLQDRRHRGLREGRLHSPRSQAAARLLGARGPCIARTSSDTTPSATPRSARPGSC